MPPHMTSCDHMIKQSSDFAALAISHHFAKFDDHTLCESVNVTNHELSMNFHDMMILLYLVIKEKFE